MARPERPLSRTEARRLEQRVRLAEQRAELAGAQQSQAERERAGAVARVQLLEAERDRAWTPMLDSRLPRRLTIATILAAVPSMAEQFDVEVPLSALTADGAIACPCGASTPLPRNELRECAGGCGRWFLRGERRVWRAIAPAPPDVEAGAA
jgi:hypothetical protein